MAQDLSEPGTKFYLVSLSSLLNVKFRNAALTAGGTYTEMSEKWIQNSDKTGNI